ncbi:MAG: methyltransferase domain-containing protein, partial [Gemmatimonadaceae bacterium]
PQLHGDVAMTHESETRWLLNARVALSPAELEHAVRAAVSIAADGAEVTWEEFACFSPGRPTPAHRYATRCGSAGDATCCAAFYQRDDVRKLLGDSYHPGGIDLTLRMMRAVGLEPDATVLDVACGTGESLRAILAEWPVRGIGIDSVAPTTHHQRLDFRSGDAHALPSDDGSVDVVLCECALSTFNDQSGALREMHRVLRPGGFVAVSDMVLEGDVPETLRDWVHSGTCLERALSMAAYERALHDAGFTLVTQWDASEGLTELLMRIKRNLIGWISAAASGTVSTPLPFDAREARATLRDASKAVADGSIRYGVFIGRRDA